ncbi:hypothetical protein BDV93DRAFT_509267 [Ceratobasidium sp. AG-I]|nr:hypothetical protein BDV93DRAFT_509267 [Ceratobasidium sp. AG-I]
MYTPETNTSGNRKLRQLHLISNPPTPIPTPFPAPTPTPAPNPEQNPTVTQATENPQRINRKTRAKKNLRVVLSPEPKEAEINNPPPANLDNNPILKDLHAEELERQDWIRKVAEHDKRADLGNLDTNELKRLWETAKSANSLKKASALFSKQNSKIKVLGSQHPHTAPASQIASTPKISETSSVSQGLKRSRLPNTLGNQTKRQCPDTGNDSQNTRAQNHLIDQRPRTATPRPNHSASQMSPSQSQPAHPNRPFGQSDYAEPPSTQHTLAQPTPVSDDH